MNTIDETLSTLFDFTNITLGGVMKLKVLI